MYYTGDVTLLVEVAHALFLTFKEHLKKIEQMTGIHRDAKNVEVVQLKRYQYVNKWFRNESMSIEDYQV